MPEQIEDNARNEPYGSSQRKQNPPTNRSSKFKIPPVLKQVFDKFPLVTYPVNQLPLRSPTERDQNVLYVFTSPEDARNGAPSFNPSCLKWQTYLHMNRIPFRTSPSTNHASPSGSLPYLITAHSPATAVPESATSLVRWTSLHSPNPTPSSLSPIEAAYNALLTMPIRLAYLYALYLHPGTFRAVAEPLYISSATSSAFVKYCLTFPLRAAALEEIINATVSGPGKVDVERLFKDAEEAFEALSAFLGQHEWFSQAARKRDGKTEKQSHGKQHSSKGFQGPASERDEFEAQGSRQRDSEQSLFEDGGDEDIQDDIQALEPGEAGPGILDAAVFAYTHVILDLFGKGPQGKNEAWSPATRLVSAVRDKKNLKKHRDMIVENYYSNV